MTPRRSSVCARRQQARWILLGVACFALGRVPAARAEIIYKNTTTVSDDALVYTPHQAGDEVRATGDARSVTELDIGVSQQGIAGTADLQAFLYANDGPGGAPGTLLWQSDVMSQVHLRGPDELICFAVPDVLVPDVFTWTIQISNTQPVAVGLPLYGPATVGNTIGEWASFPGDPWNQVDFGANEARIVATTVPEPASATLLGIGFAIISAATWRLRRARA